ncbi:Foramidopyrimidine DNA glycosylase [Mycoplasmopsis bovigenitalium 51080]|uniref:Formamidopyrimidine-DNA glycosylase n=1 Tax=Mycoplasmopsis bovigenitalium 51080 TaxID=1188235 RepID=N9TVN1_9BACT|nr:DNA-formamidopyrimidine glycosylase [Mycoplasmopsis bovigenitalium]ENY70179.1 Foramidopyrimidine DNA glycosylase [Mycoplasmopsis bovigenitalium 51080]
MPELPEVTIVARELNSKVKNLTIKSININKEKLIKEIDHNQFKNELIGQKITAVKNIGKHIIFELTNDLFIISHLRMSGKYSFYKEFHRPQIHDHVIFNLDEGFLYYNDARAFGTFHLKTKQTIFNSPPLNKLASEPNNININELHKKLKNRNMPIKNALLDQTLILGIGNIYANEALWEQKIHPSTPSKLLDINTLGKLVNSAGIIMDKSIELGGSSIQSYESMNGKRGLFQNFLKVHGKNNQACSRCQTLIIKYKLGGRGTYYCPKCQRGNYEI